MIFPKPMRGLIIQSWEKNGVITSKVFCTNSFRYTLATLGQIRFASLHYATSKKKKKPQAIEAYFKYKK
jgi:hypothetical protein